MTRPRSQLARLLALFAVAALTLAIAPAAVTAGQPSWVRHVLGYPGGISNGVREREAVALGQTTTTPLATTVSPSLSTLENVQMNGDSDPPLPQDEPAVALNLEDPMNAVAASNDYTGDGFWIGFTTDGGHTWTSQWKDPKFSFDQSRCYASDPTIAYSLRDHAFYMGTLCYFSGTPASEIHVWRSDDGGATWSDSTKPALVVTNHASDGSIDASVFNDKELMAIDNVPGSPTFGRIYVTYTKFHMTGSLARSDYCPIQLAYTDAISASDPSTSVWQHTPIVPDDPGGKGVGASANQFSTPVVDEQGGLDVAFVSEDCNTSYDRALYFARSTTGGATFGQVVRVDHPGEWTDNPNRNDYLGGLGQVRLPGTISLAYDATRSRLVLLVQNAIDLQTSGTNISAQTSDDFGATWSSASPVSVTGAGDPAPGQQFFPAVGVDGSGTYSAIWQDTRNHMHRIETFQGTSTDGGQTWTNTLISTAAFDPRQSFFTCGCFIGDYNQIAVADSVVYPVWTDGRNSPGRPAGDTDVFTNVEIAT
ncbi:MAG: hypothetical protein ACM3WR_02285 [Solirubrobacterales bacterium]